METLKIGWLQNHMIGMENPDKIVFRDPAGKFVFLNAEHPENKNQEFDGIIIYNHCNKDISLKFPAKTLIMVHNEPAYTSLGWNAFMFDIRHISQADVLFTSMPNRFKVKKYYNYSLLNYDWKRVSSYPVDHFHKSKTLSCVASSKTISIRHAQRAVYLEYLKANMPNCKLYGREINPVKHLEYGLKDYKFSIAIENTTEENFFTEKVLYCFHTLCFPFYDGCSNLEKFFPKESFQRIDIMKPAESLEIIKEIINKKTFYEERLEALIKARQNFYDEYELFSRVAKEIRTIHQDNSNLRIEKQTILSPSVHTTDHLLQLNTGYCYAKLIRPYILNGKPLPYNIEEEALSKAKKINYALPHAI